MKILISFGTRPEIIKMAPIIRELEKSDHEFVLVHSGQHYDKNMSGDFITSLGLPKPENMRIGSGSHAEMTSKAMVGFEKKLIEHMPDLVLVQGDTNTTLASALAAVKMHIPVGHVEAGIRSFDRMMPEEINRIIVDQCSELLFAPNKIAKANLLNAGIDEKRIFTVGNTIADAVRQNIGLPAPDQIKLPKEFILLTIHRSENVDNAENLGKLVEILNSLDHEVLFPIHPRTKGLLKSFGYLKKLDKGIKLIKPVGYFDFLRMLKRAKIVLTDSGGVQEEAAILNVPCLTLRYSTERPETVKAGKNILVGLEKDKIVEFTTRIFDDPKFRKSMKKSINLYGKDVSKKIVRGIDRLFRAGNIKIKRIDSLQIYAD